MNVTNILVWIILGGVAGWIASILTGRNKRMGCLANIIVGVVGALIGGFVVGFLGGAGITGFNLPSLVVAVLGAVILLAITGMWSRR
jgi:uncharacterized membrane protein YeaQ/YmgE (transglycosylase-associated protein family)